MSLDKEFLVNKLKTEAAKSWDIFYKNNASNFFKDRHWPVKEFPELNADKAVLLEVGCGVGNLVFPVLFSTNLEIKACDFSPRAVDLLRKSQYFDANRIECFECDLTTETLNNTLADSSVDIVSMMFVLSAIPPSRFEIVLSHIAKVLKPGGKLLFRDYGLNDAAQLRFKSENFVDSDGGFFVRSDNTFSYFFTVEQITELIAKFGFSTIECFYKSSKVVNRKLKKSMDRVFVQGRFEKTK